MNKSYLQTSLPHTVKHTVVGRIAYLKHLTSQNGNDLHWYKYQVWSYVYLIVSTH